jgi:transposase
MALISNIAGSKPETLYSQYKSRCAIEQLFDSLKNLLVADRTYMRTDDGLEGWMFVNFIALSWYCRIYAKLLDNNLISQYSAADVLQRAAKIKKVRINDKWHTSEIAAKTQKLLTAIACPVT